MARTRSRRRQGYREVQVEKNGKMYRGWYYIDQHTITVSSSEGRKSRRLGTIGRGTMGRGDLDTLAKLLLKELIPDS